MSIALNGEGIVVAWRGDFAAAARVIAEADAVTQATGTRIAPYGAMLLAALRGREAEARALIDDTIRDATADGEGLAVQYAQWTTAVLYARVDARGSDQGMHGRDTALRERKLCA